MRARIGKKTDIIDAYGTVTKVVDAQKSLDAHIVQSYELVGFEGDTVLFIARWTPGYSDLYKATLSAQ